MTLQLEMLPVLVVGRFETMEAKKLVDVACSAQFDVVSADLSGPGEAHENARGRSASFVKTSIEQAHAAGLPYHLGFLIGIGETAQQRMDTIRDFARFCAADPYLQDIRLSPFQPLAGTPMKHRPPLSFEEISQVVKTVKEVFPVHQVAIPPQAFSRFPELGGAGINDLGSVPFHSPDEFLPGFPVPTLEDLREKLFKEGIVLQERLPLTTPAGFRRPAFNALFEAVKVRIKNRGVSSLTLEDDHRCFGCGTKNPHGLHLSFTMTGVFVCQSVWTGTPDFQGYAGIVHGGILTTLLDELMGQCLIRSGVRAVTADIHIRFVKPTPVGKPLTIVGMRVGGRKHMHFTRGTVTLPDGTITVEAEGRFVEC